MTSQQDELALLDKVLFRLASADDDQALELAVNKWLPSCLLKLNSGQEGVRKKVMELLVHINKRIKDNSNIQLPMDALIVQYQDPSATSFVTNFTIIYLKMGFPRLPKEKKASLVPAILSSLEKKPLSHQDSLLLMMIPVLENFRAPEDDEKRKGALGLSEKPHLSKLLSSFLLDYLLLPYGSHPSLMSAPPADEPEDPHAPIRIHPGLSEAGWKRVSGETPVKAEELEKNKVGVVRFLGKGLLEASETAVQLVVASADTRHSVSSEAESQTRRLMSTLDFDSPAVVAKIYSLFLGTVVVKKGGGGAQSKSELRRAPASTRIRLKLMPRLLRSREAAAQFPSCVQVTFDLLFGAAGNTNTKLRTMAVTFVHHIVESCPEDKLTAIGGMLVSAMTRVVKEEANNAKLRASCYVAIGKLGQKVPSLVNKDATMIQTFFNAISREDEETQMSVQEAMGLMASSFRNMEKTSLVFLEAMLSTYVEKEEPKVRLVTVQYAGEVFPHTHVPTRHILAIGAGDPKDEVAAAARNHLLGALKKYAQQQDSTLRKYHQGEEMQREDLLPDFEEMLKLVLDKASVRIKSQDRFLVGEKVLPYNPAVCLQLVSFLRMCLLHSAGVLPSEDSLEDPEFEAPAVARYLSSSVDPALVRGYSEFVERSLDATRGSSEARAMLQAVGCSSSEGLSRNHAKKLAWLKGLLADTKEDVRDCAAQVFSVVAATLRNDDFERATADLSKNFKGQSLESQHGVILALAHSFGRRMLLARIQGGEDGGKSAWPSYKAAIVLIIGQLRRDHPMVVGAACSAIAELGRCGPLELEDGAEEKEEEEERTKLGLVRRLLELLKAGKTPMKTRERAATALGQLCVGDATFPHRKLVLRELLGCAQEIKDVELHFTMGESVYCAMAGPLASKGRDKWRQEEGDFEPVVDPSASDEHIKWTLDEFCQKLAASTHPNVKQASCLWLLAVARYGKNLQKVSERMLDIQSAFMTFLGDGNDIVQDAASKGLGLVYESSSESGKEKLVESLLGTLTSDRARGVQKVSGETKIFQEAEMGKTPTGDNLTTYRELCSLATDLNQPDLVYKFMNLANNHAMWNSRRGAAFGFSSIAARAGRQMEAHLPKIVPKLYRYQFDPTPKIQESMSAIWSALVPETAKTLDRYLPEILEELCANLTSNQWRVRESCCLAVVDLLRGRSLDDALYRIPDLWRSLFRVMDDIKESVRGAGAKAADSLSRTCIRMCDAEQSGTKHADAAVKAVLPVLLEEGLQSSVAEVRAVVVGTVVKLARSAGSSLKPHLPILIPAFLEAASEMEAKEVNYLSVRMSNDPSVQERLDLARIAAAKASPMMECVNFALQFVDADTLNQLVPRLVELIKGHVGLGTKGTAAHVVTVLTHQCPNELQPHAGKLLAAFVSGLSDPNAAVRKTFAAAIGQLMRSAKDSSLEKLFARLRTWYLEDSTSQKRLAVVHTYDAINQHNPDRIKAHAAQSIPLVFLAMHEEKEVGVNDQILEIWEEVWSDNTPGTEGGVRMYLKEIVSLLSAAAESQSWKTKAQSCRAMGVVAAKLGSTIPAGEQARMMTVLVNSLAGRTWDGKEAVVTALADACAHGKGSEGVRAMVAAEEGLSVAVVMEALFRECRKEKRSYRRVALSCTGRIIRELELECFSKLYEIAFPLIKVKEKDEEDDEEDEEAEESEQMLELRQSVYDCLSSAWAAAPSEDQDSAIVDLSECLASRAEATTKRNMMSIVAATGRLLAGWKEPHSDVVSRSRALSAAGRTLSVCLAQPKATQLRMESLSALRAAVEILRAASDPAATTAFRAALGKGLEDAVRDVAAEAAAKAAAREAKAALMELPALEEKEEEDAKMEEGAV